MTAEIETAFDRMQGTARRVSDGQLELARELAEFQASGVWRERYASFDEYVINELRILPGRAGELLRMHRKLVVVALDPATASEIGWDTLKTVSSKLRVETVGAMLPDLKSENIQTIRERYCPRTSNHNRRVSACVSTEPACQRGTPPNCCTEAPESRTPPAQAVDATATGSGTEPAVGAAVGNSGTRNAPADGSESGDLLLAITELVAVAMCIAERQMGRCSVQNALNGICAVFISLMGSPSEKQWVKQHLRAEQEKLRRGGLPSTPASTPQQAPRRAESRRC